MTHVEWVQNVSVQFLPCFLPFVIFGLCLTTLAILLQFSASDSLHSLLHAYKCDHGFMSFNITE
jgi:hypothetical protein